jgi:signal transduction histidine kinase
MANALLSADHRTPRYLLGFAVALAFVTAGETLLRALGVAGPNAPAVFADEFLIGLLTTVPFVVLLGYAGYWLERSDLGPGRYSRVGAWTAGGTISFLAINLALMAVIPVDPWIAVAWARWAVAIGGGIGVLVGVSEARAIHSAIEAERAALEAEHLESQRDLLEYLNGLLRHEVLNAANVVSGYAATLMDEHSPGDRTHDYSETIYRQSEDMAAVIRDVRVLLNAMAGESELESVDLGDVLAEEVEKLEERYERVEVETDVPDGVRVRANALLPRVFWNLLSNAVEHNGGDTPHVSVVVEAATDAVAVEITDDGSGIPDGAADTLFARPDLGGADHGIGLYLVSVLVDSYGGTIELTDTGPDGSTFTVELPLGAPDLAGRVASERPTAVSS